MHELSGCCDSHSNHLHHCLLSTALTCHIAIGLVITLSFDWMRGSCFGSIFFNFSSPGRPPTTWPLRYVSKSPPTVHDINAWSLHSAPTQCTLLVELCIVHVFVHVKFHVMMWSSDALDPGFLATRVLPGAIGHFILRTSVKPRRIPLSNSQDPELVLLSLD